MSGDPRFSNRLTGDFHPRPGSPLLDAGIATSATRDLDGILRPSGAAFDLGAYETARAPKGDVDRDGFADLVFRSSVNGVQNKVWFMNGVARASEAAILPDAASADWKIRGVDDFSGDGRNDLVFWNQTLSASADFDHDGRPDRRNFLRETAHDHPQGLPTLGTALPLRRSPGVTSACGANPAAPTLPNMKPLHESKPCPSH